MWFFSLALFDQLPVMLGRKSEHLFIRKYDQPKSIAAWTRVAWVCSTGYMGG